MKELSNLSKEELVKELIKYTDEGIEGITNASRCVRILGLKKVKQGDLPQEWTDAAKEHLIWKAGLYVEVPEDIFEGWLKSGAGSSGFSLNYIRRKAQRWRQQKLVEERQQRTMNEAGVKIYVADITLVKSLQLGMANAVITDPPYEKESLPLWGELIRFSSDVLIDHGWLIAMSGQRWLPEVFNTLMNSTKDNNMRYCWTIAVHTPGAESAQGWIGKRNPLNSEWKPIIVFSKGEPTDWPEGYRDFIQSEGNEGLKYPKGVISVGHHEWGQSLNVFEWLVKGFSKPDGLVTDPFLGGGTTAVAARKNGRSFEGFDIKDQYVTESVLRIEMLNEQK